MIEIGTKILEVVWLLFRLIRPGGVQGLIAEVFLLRQQLLVLKREKPKCPPLTTVDRLIMGFCTHLMTPKRIGNSAIAIAASTLLDFHRALMSRKYSRLFSKKGRSKPGPKGPSRELLCWWAMCSESRLTTRPCGEFSRSIIDPLPVKVLHGWCQLERVPINSGLQIFFVWNRCFCVRFG